ncbi:MAG: response regulator [Hyphomicrobiaceae bacterium]|nr:response regulator [Hyphomicrobiaceae bacterium]
MAGKRIFVAEDETLIAMVLEDMIAELGFELAASAPSLSKAMNFVASSHPIDAAILDIELNDEKSWPIADALMRRQVPFAFSTGHGRDADVDPRFANAPILDKPFDTAALGDVLAQLLDRR